MPIKKEIPKPNRTAAAIPKKTVNDKKKETAKIASKIPKLISIQRTWQLAEPSAVPSRVPMMVANEPNMTTEPAAKKEIIRPKNLPTRTNFTDAQKKADSKLNPSDESSQKPAYLRTASALKPKGYKLAPNKSRSNLSSSSRIQLDSSVTEICRPTTPRPLKIQTKNPYIPKYQMRRTLTCDENHLRVSEKNKIQAFEVVQDKLREMQSSFIKKWENLKDITTTKIKGPFKFISMVQNDNCKVIVNEDDLIRLPKNLPRQSVSDLKETVKESFCSSLDMLDKYFQELELFEIKADLQTVLESIRNKLEHHQERKKEGLLKIIDGMCKNSSTAETELARALDKLQEIESKFNKLKLEAQKEKSALIAQHEAELDKEIKTRKDTVAKILRQSIISSSVQATLSQKDEKIDLKNNKIHDLLSEVNDLKNCVKELKTDKQKNIDNILTLECQINDLKQKLKLYEIDINQLQKKLEETEKLQTPNVTPVEICEIFSLKQKLVQTENDLMSLQEQHKKSNELLEFRSEIINTLESRETELSAKVGTLEHQNLEKNSLITHITTDFQNKSDDFRVMADTLEQKYDEVITQNNIIKLLEENNGRNQKLRVQQEEKIAELGAEISRLRKGGL